MVFIHVIRERPSGLQQFPAREAVKICFASVSSGIHAMCPNRDRRLDWTMAERWGCLVNLLTSSSRQMTDIKSVPHGQKQMHAHTQTHTANYTHHELSTIIS